MATPDPIPSACPATLLARLAQAVAAGDLAGAEEVVEEVACDVLDSVQLALASAGVGTDTSTAVLDVVNSYVESNYL
jgi:hypothetical protein